MKRFPIPENGYAVDFGTVDGVPTVYMARFSKGKQRTCYKLSPAEAEDLSRQLASASARAAGLGTQQD